MTNRFQPSGLTRGLDVLIDAEWTPEQALAVIELLDDIRQRIWEHYQLPILTLKREMYGVIEDGDHDNAPSRDEDEAPF
jgi:hypothetical protein